MSRTRIPIVVHPKTKETIMRLAQAMDSSFAKTAGAFLDDAEPHLRKLADSMECQDGPNVSFSRMYLALLDAQQSVLDQQVDMFQEITKKQEQDQ